MSLTLGIDIGGTKIAGAFIDERGAILRVTQRSTEAAKGGPHVLANALDLAAALLDAEPTCTRIGIGAGGRIDVARGIVVSATDVLPGWASTDLRGSFEKRFGLPTSAENDVNALALGEQRFGAAVGKKTVLFLALGTGVGGALIADGKIYHGAHWGGGEFGHLIVDAADDARADTGESVGTLEAHCSGAGLVRTWRALSGDMLPTTGEDIGRMTAENPDGDAAKAIRETGAFLGIGLVSLANILDPEIIIIGGGLVSLGDILLDSARRVLRERALSGPSACPVVCAALGSNASVIGAACVALAE